MQIILLAGIYSIDGFNTKLKEAVLRQKLDSKSPEIKDLKLIIHENYVFTAHNKFFIVLNVHNNYL